MPVRDSAACEWLKSATSGRSPIAGERPLAKKAVIPETIGDWKISTQTRGSRSVWVRRFGAQLRYRRITRNEL